MGWIPLSKGFWTEVDDADVEWLSQFKWCVKASGGDTNGCPYAARTVRANSGFETIRMHRLIMDCPKGMEVDHLNSDRLDNKRANLKICTHSENMARRWKNYED